MKSSAPYAMSRVGSWLTCATLFYAAISCVARPAQAGSITVGTDGGSISYDYNNEVPAAASLKCRQLCYLENVPGHETATTPFNWSLKNFLFTDKLGNGFWVSDNDVSSYAGLWPDPDANNRAWVRLPLLDKAHDRYTYTVTVQATANVPYLVTGHNTISHRSVAP